jgi:LCP family protein required for cell wall assembly
LGSDSRGKNIKGSRSDSIILLQVNPDHSAQMVSFPRDSKVDIPGRGNSKINSALAYGGPELTVRTVEQFSGLKINYYMITSFPGLQNLINEIGGVKINVDMSVHDKYSGANLNAGSQRITGGQALAFARARHNTPNGDFTRADHQQDIVEAVFRQEKTRRRDFASMAKLIPLVLRETETDLPNQELFRLIRFVLNVNPKKVSKTVLKGNTGMSGGASVVFIDEGFAAQKFAQMKAKS